ncbi:hypothetical protein SNE40_017510 [Patella caerulea]|uniref:Uncharacterized protein n=1 Tax=Patella caerulea TaxID=87958 RepID=A0AAN8JE06_PATCE
MKGNLTKLKFELETIQCKISNERKHFKDSCENVDSFVQRAYYSLLDSGDEVKNKMERLSQYNVMKLKQIAILKANAISSLEATISHTGDALKNQSIEEMIKVSRDMKSIQQLKEADENFTLPNLQLYSLFPKGKVSRTDSFYAHGSVIYFDSNGKTRDTKQCHTSTIWETMCRFMYYYYRFIYYHYLMSFPWVYPFYFIFMCFKVPLCFLLWLFAMRRLLTQPTPTFFERPRRNKFEDAVDAYNWATQPFNYCICDIFANTEGFEVNFSKKDLESGMLTCRSPDYIRYGCHWHIVVSSGIKAVDLQICRNNRDCCDGTLVGVRIVDVYGVGKSLTKIDMYGYSSSCYNWTCAVDLRNLRSDIFKIQIVLFEKDDFIYR